MSSDVVPKTQSKKDWFLNETAFRNLLAWLDDGKDSQGNKYLEMRRRLVAYFDRKGSRFPDELADETLNRVARRLEEEGAIGRTAPAQYCYIVARFVFLEETRNARKSPVALEGEAKDVHFNGPLTSRQDDIGTCESHERRLNCLEKCFGTIDADDRDLIVQYYQGEQHVKIENRRLLAERLGVTANALSIRACRIRSKLDGCVSGCMERAGRLVLPGGDRASGETAE